MLESTKTMEDALVNKTTNHMDQALLDDLRDDAIFIASDIYSEMEACYA